MRRFKAENEHCKLQRAKAKTLLHVFLKNVKVNWRTRIL